MAQRQSELLRSSLTSNNDLVTIFEAARVEIGKLMRTNLHTLSSSKNFPLLWYLLRMSTIEDMESDATINIVVADASRDLDRVIVR